MSTQPVLVSAPRFPNPRNRTRLRTLWYRTRPSSQYRILAAFRVIPGRTTPQPHCTFRGRVSTSLAHLCAAAQRLAVALYGGDTRPLRAAVIAFVRTLQSFNIKLHVVLDAPPSAVANGRKLLELKRRMKDSVAQRDQLMQLCRWVFLSIVQGPFSVAPCQTLNVRFATFT